MSQDNVDVVRASLDRWNRGERDTFDFHPDIEFIPRRAATEGAYRGTAGMERFLADTEETFDKFEFRVEMLDHGDQVLVWGTIHVRAKQSGVETDIPTGGVVELRDGKVVRWEDFGSKAKAFEAVGLGLS